MLKLPKLRNKQSATTQGLDASTRLRRLQDRLSAVDRILSPVYGMKIVANHGTPAPAWTNGEFIWLNAAYLPELSGTVSKLDLAVWLGANHHEVGHSLYSPRTHSELRKGIARLEKAGMYSGLARVENIVEDQRQERLLIARFRPWRTYLISAAMRIVVEGLAGRQAPDIGATWPWIVGRTWLPADVRARSKAAWPGDSDELASLVGQYQHLRDPGEDQYEEAIQLLVDIRQCLVEGGEDIGNLPTGCQSNKTNDLAGDTEPQTLTADDDVVPSAGSDEDDEQLADADADADAETDEDEADSADDLDGGDGEEQGSDDSDTGDDGADVGDSESRDSEPDLDDGDDDDGVPPAADEVDGPSGTGLGDELDEFIEDLQDQIKDQVANDPAVKKAIDEARASLEDMTSENKSELTPDPTVRLGDSYEDAPAEAQRLGRDVSLAFRELTDTVLPYWERRVERGKLNIRRFMNRTSVDRLDTMFDRFQQGMQDEVSLDVTVLVDTSTSMLDVDLTGITLSQQAAQATYAIQKAVEAADGDCTVVEFNDLAHLLSQTGRRPHPTKMKSLHPRGGTNPSPAVEDTWVRLRSVEAYHKVVIVVSDGQWYQGGEVMRDLTDQGVITVAVQLDPYVDQAPNYIEEGPVKDRDEWMEAHRATAKRYSEIMGCEYTEVMADCRDMVPLFKDLVVKEMEKAIAQGVMAQ